MRSLNFTQQRGTAPIGPGKEEQEKGDEREGWEKGGRGEGGVKNKKSEGEEGGLEGWIQAPLAQRVSRREELWRGRELPSTSLRSSRTRTLREKGVKRRREKEGTEGGENEREEGIERETMGARGTSRHTHTYTNSPSSALGLDLH
ncbi:hypothetical protein NQZ68_014117 [Dissostichus eleginoides]|nr:hypothetical protein NQZ68_014117 [Dissostichus eleginoides]